VSNCSKNYVINQPAAADAQEVKATREIVEKLDFAGAAQEAPMVKEAHQKVGCFSSIARYVLVWC